VKRNGKSVTDATAFPVFNQFPLTKDQHSSLKRKVKGMGYTATRRIIRVEPYKGRNNPLWRLHELNRIDKHRLLIPVGAAVGRFNLGQHVRKARVFGFSDRAADFWVGTTKSLLVETGQELLTDLPDSEVNEDIQFIFEVVVNEIGVSEGEPVILVLRQSFNVVRSILRDF
jgi:hypothetical protein